VIEGGEKGKEEGSMVIWDNLCALLPYAFGEVVRRAAERGEGGKGSSESAFSFFPSFSLIRREKKKEGGGKEKERRGVGGAES